METNCQSIETANLRVVLASGITFCTVIETAMVLQQITGKGPRVGVHKQSVCFTDTAFAFARELVERGE